MAKILYFASLREKLECEQEEVGLADAGLRTIDALLAYLKARGNVWDTQFTKSGSFLIAINQNLTTDESAEITDEDEIAFFPPVSGG